MSELVGEGSSIFKTAAWTLRSEPAYLTDLALRQAELITLDSIGCAYSSRKAATPRLVAELIRELGGAPTCSVIGHGFRTSVLNATLLNCALVRSQDFNDVQFIIKEGSLHVGGHCSDTLPVALAVGESLGSSGLEVLAAIIMSYELFSRLRNLMPFSSVWDQTSVSGIISAAITGRLLKLDQTRQAHALALAAARSATPEIVRYGKVSGAKNMVHAFNAQHGVQSALLAEKGLTGPLEILDHELGLQTVFEPALDYSQLWAPVEQPLLIMKSHIKDYSCLGTGQTEAAAALSLHSKVKGRLDQIESIDVVMGDTPIIRKQLEEVHRLTPSTHESADHSFTFLAAVCLMDGELTERQYANERWNDPATKALIAKVRLSVSEDLRARSPDSMPCRVKIHMTGGEIIESECLRPPGHSDPSRGLNEDAVLGKFRINVTPFLTAGKQETLVRALLSLRDQKSVSSVMRLTSTAP